MSGTMGKNLRVTVFGQSHSPAIGVTVDGLPAGFRPDMARVRAFLARRAPGRALTSARAEADEIEVLSGLYQGVACGAPLTCVIRNTDARPGDYARIARAPRPGHADYTAFVKYAGHNDASGGGQFSGRLTAPLCVAGALALQLLERVGVRVAAHALSIARVSDSAFNPVAPEIDAVTRGFIPALDESAARDMEAEILLAMSENDSVGGVVECAVVGLPAGVGEPLFDGIESAISRAVFSVPAVKGVEFGAGFGCARLRGSENNDAFTLVGGRVATVTNNSGGVLGGISSGMPIIFRAAIKPTPSIGLPQRTVDLDTLCPREIEIKGRHDPCIVPRAVPCIEAACALALCDLYIDSGKGGFE